ncbi:MAG: hypothetical protein AAF409_11230 [Pseudomonadota bacterium]
MVARRITSTFSADFVPLGTPGQRSFDLITREAAEISSAHKALFAEPFVSPQGDSIDWYAALSGNAVPLTSLDPTASQAARLRLDSLIGDVEARAVRLRGETDPERRRLGEALANSVIYPGDESIFVVGDQPVIVCWAHQSIQGAAPVSALTQASPRRVMPAAVQAAGTTPLAADTPVTATGQSDPVGQEAAVAKDRGSFTWLWWLLWGAVGAMAVAIAVLLLPACGLSFIPGLDRCADERVVSAAAEEVARQDALEAEITRLERQLEQQDLVCLPTPPPPVERRAEAPICAPGEIMQTAAQTLILVDASTSMRGGIETPREMEDEIRRLWQVGQRRAYDRLRRVSETQHGTARIEVVKRLLQGVLTHERANPIRIGSFNRCGTAKISRPMSEPSEITAAIERIRLGNYTALADAIRIGATEIAGDAPASLIVISDGYDSCDGDPCAAARQAKAANADLSIHVVDLVGVPELRCVAEETSGRYFERPDQLDTSVLEVTLSEATNPDGICVPEPTPVATEPSPETDDIDRRVQQQGGETDALLRVTLAWDNISDLDLRVNTPSDCAIYHAKREACGGKLDIDQNARADRLATPVENVVFESQPERGSYMVIVKNFEQRASGATAFKLRIHKGGQVEEHQGSFERSKQTATFRFNYP